MKKEKIPGGLSKGKSLKDIAIMHAKSSGARKSSEREIEKMHDYLKMELKKGIKTELEHTNDKNVAREIAMDHIYEDPKYYTKLSKIEEMNRTKKINLNDLSKMVKKALNEEFVGGVNYDNVLASELKQKVGNLDKLTPYVLELGDGKLDIQSDSSGKIHVTDVDSGKKLKIFKDIDDFLRGIKYGPIKLSEENISMAPHQDHEAKMAKAELRDMVKNAKEIYSMIQDGDSLPGWISAYITLASDYMHSVNEYMVEHNSDSDTLDESELQEGHSDKIQKEALKWVQKYMDCTIKETKSGYMVCPSPVMSSTSQCYTVHRGGDRGIFELYRFLAKAYNVSKNFLEQAINQGQDFEWVKQKTTEKKSQDSDIQKEIIVREDSEDQPRKLTMAEFAEWLGFPVKSVETAIQLVRLSDPDGAYSHLEDMGEYEAAEAVDAIYFEHGSLKEAMAACREDLGF